MAGEKEKETTENIWEYAKKQAYAGISKMFKETLMDGLHPHLRDMHTYFHALRPVALEEREKLYQENKKEIDAGMPYSGDLLLYGITPVMIFDACEAISELFDRLICTGVIRKEFPCFSRASSTFSCADAPNLHSMVLKEVSAMCGCPIDVSVKIIEWFCGILPYKPHLFRKFRARCGETEIRFEYVQPHEEKTIERWKT